MASSHRIFETLEEIMEYVEDLKNLEEALEHAKAICLNHRTGKHVLEPDDYESHRRLVVYLSSLDMYRIAGTFPRNAVLEDLKMLDTDIDTLEKSLNTKEFSCEACKNDHQDLLRWMKDLKQISTWD